MNEMVTFQLINAYCKPLLTYACECVKFNRSDISQLDRAWNSVFNRSDLSQLDRELKLCI